jgi:hypothetical protein
MSSLDSFKLEYEDMERRKFKVSKEAVKKLKKAEPKQPKEKKALNVDIRTYSKIKRLGLAIEFCSIRGVKAMIVTLGFIEVLVQFKRVKR